MNNQLQLKTVLIDDESDALSVLRSLLNKYCPNIDIVGEAQNVADGVYLIRQSQPQVVLLDIQLGNNSGFDVLDKFINPSFYVIFVTAYDDFALKAFQYNAMDYLLKPIDPTTLTKAIDKAQNTFRKEVQLQQQVRNLMEGVQSGTFERLALTTAEGIEFVEIKEILYLQSDVNYTHFFLSNGEQILVSKSLKEYDSLLAGANFFRIHQSYLVNIQYVKKILKEDGGIVQLKNNVQLPISRRKKEAFLKRLMEVG